MKKILISQKAFHFSLLFGLFCALFLSLGQFDAACDELRTNVLRLHIIANSDSDFDQALKLKVRDAVLKESPDLFGKAHDTRSAIETARSSTEEINAIAKNVLKENGVGYSSATIVGKSYFGTREYDDFTLPAGEYDSVIITLGDGGGKNWWCVIFPEVCLPAASEVSLNKSANEQGCEIAYNKERYILRFKTVEIYEDIKKLIKN